MIPFAVAAGVACLLVVGRDVWKRAGEPYATMRMPVAGVWAVSWLSYGFNTPDFPSPAAWSLVVMTTACLGALLSCPVGYLAPEARQASDVEWAWLDRAFLVLALCTIAWDLYFVVGLVDADGLQVGLAQHRLDRGIKAGAWALPGLEVAHAAITAAGALGYARWRRSGRWPGAILATFGLTIAFLSTGRWDVVAYVVWLLAIHAFTDPRRGPGAVVRQGLVYAGLVVYFVAQGQVFGKIEFATTLAQSSTEQRAVAAGRDMPTVSSSGRPADGASGPPAAVVEPSQPAPASAATSGVATLPGGSTPVDGANRAAAAVVVTPQPAPAAAASAGAATVPGGTPADRTNPAPGAAVVPPQPAPASTAAQPVAAGSAVPSVPSASGPGNETTPEAGTVAERPACERWQTGATSANLGFRRMSSVERVLMLYFSGPLATLDRSLCEGAAAERPVLMYWPNKIARVLGLMDAAVLPVVDPFLDIGIPFNNYTVIYQFLSEVGPRAGLFAWLIVGVVIGVGSRFLIRTSTIPGLVAGTAPLAMAIRTPWTNAYFDGTLVVWIAVALAPLALGLMLRPSARSAGSDAA